MWLDTQGPLNKVLLHVQLLGTLQKYYRYTPRDVECSSQLHLLVHEAIMGIDSSGSQWRMLMWHSDIHSAHFIAVV